MAATQQDITKWFDDGIAQGATHMIVVCDTFDYEDYPIYVSPAQDVRSIERKTQGRDMQKVMEIYNLSMDKNSQLAQQRSFNY